MDMVKRDASSLEGLSSHRIMGKILCEMYEISQENSRLDRDKIAQLNTLAHDLIEKVGDMTHKRGSYSAMVGLSSLLLGAVSIPFAQTALQPIFQSLIQGGVINEFHGYYDKPLEAKITVLQFKANQEDKDSSHMQSSLDKDSTLELMQSTFAKLQQADEVRA
jgi:hypothetical protein